MKVTCFSRCFAVMIAVTTFTACTEFVSENNGIVETIGLPGNVNVMNENLANAKSRTGSDLLEPAIHTSIFSGSAKPFYLRYTTSPGIQQKQTTSVSTRGTLITTDSFYDSYSLYSYVYKKSGTWATVASSKSATYSDEQILKSASWNTGEFWPGNGVKCAFFAYAPYHIAGLSAFTTTGWPTFHYVVPASATAQNDLLVTRNDISTGISDYGNIDVPGDFNAKDYITFDHACAAIRFAIGKQMAPCTIKKIEIQNVYGEADYQYQTESWTNIATLATFNLTQDIPVKATDSNVILNNSNDVFMMIPQKVPAGAVIAVTINDGADHVLKANIENDLWEKGHTVTYYLSTAGVNTNYVLSVSPAAASVTSSGGNDAITVKSYKQTYYGSQAAVPWTASYTYDENGIIGTTVYNSTSSAVTAFTASGNGSVSGESANFTISSATTTNIVYRSHSETNSHTKTLREAVDGSCDLAYGKQTANCYVIHAPGHYSFPLVYGNALNGDKTYNTNSYGTSSFVDHQGVQIDNPYIYKTNSGANVPYDVCIVWQDAPHLITPSSLKLSSDKQNIEFDVERENICQGNSVVAVRDKDGNIMWSWHIWVTDYALTKTYEVHNANNVICNFMEVPLGYCDAEVRTGDELRKFKLIVKQTDINGEIGNVGISQFSGSYIYGMNVPYYQWGRKDPCLPSNGVGNVDKPYYDNQYISVQSMSTTNLKDMILYPYKFNVSNDYGNLELWDKGNFSAIVNNGTICKTVYDPAPVGYMEPKTDAFTGLSTSNSAGRRNYGFDFYCQLDRNGELIYFHGYGYRHRDWSGTLEFFGDGTYCTLGATCLHFNYSGNAVYPQYTYYRANGYTSWPVLQ